MQIENLSKCFIEVMMMSLQQLKNIDTKTKHAVVGYIREQHTKLFNNNRYTLFQNIPIPISSMCALYLYHLADYFELLIPIK